jgi:hypothetical protein
MIEKKKKKKKKKNRGRERKARLQIRKVKPPSETPVTEGFYRVKDWFRPLYESAE